MTKPVIKATVQEVGTDVWIHQHVYDKADVELQLADGKILLPVQLAIMNGILWTILLKFNIPITKNDVFFPDRAVDKETGKASYSFTSDTISRCTNEIYNELILKYKIPDYMDAVSAVWVVINRFTHFADRYTREYQVGLDALSLAKLCVQKPVKELIEQNIDGSHGTKYAEQQFEKTTKKLMGVLGQDGLLKDNVLMPFMRTKLLKRNQVPQMFYAFGTRSDITDEMMKHPVSASAWSGLMGVEDYAIEALSAKKAEFFNSSVIQNAQYFARCCRLASTSCHKLYPGWCGSQVTIPIRIPEKHKYNYLGKFVKVDDQTKHLLKERRWEPQWGEDYSVELTKENIDQFMGREIQMWSPFGCKHTDGFCEHCAGFMHQRLRAYVPEDIYIGVFCTTKVVSAVTQKILSAKHLIKTSSKEFILPERAARFFTKSGDAIVWTPGASKGIRKCKVRVSSDCLLGPASDLTRKHLPTGVSFSKISSIGVVDPKGNVIDFMDLTDGVTTPYFSAYTMNFLKEHYKEIEFDSSYLDIPMKDFDFDSAFLRYTSVNDDMVTYVKKVERFVMGSDGEGIVQFNTIPSALNEFSELVYTKADTNIFTIEVMLRNYLGHRDESGTAVPGVPVITDPRADVVFIGLSDVISGAALSTKESYQGMKEFLRDPRPTLDSIGGGYGYADTHFGFSRIE